MRARLLKWYNILLGALLGVLGFSSCNPIDPFRAEYGQPYADFKLIGEVSDETGKPLKGIRVLCRPETPGIEEENPWYTDTLYSDAAGKFSKDRLKFSWPDIEHFNVRFEDVDGEANGGSFKTVELHRDGLEVEQTEKGDRKWYGGAFTITAKARMEKE